MNLAKGLFHIPMIVVDYMFHNPIVDTMLNNAVVDTICHTSIKAYLKIRKPTKQSYKHQQTILFHLIDQARDTVFGRQYGFEDINSVKDFQNNIPLASYKDFEPRIHYMLRGEKDITYPGKIPRFATSSGTTGDNKKFIPITKENLRETHIKASTEILNRYYKNNPKTKLSNGKFIVIGGLMEKNPYTSKSNVGFMTAIFQKNQPKITELLRRPTNRITYLSDREQKIQKTVIQTSKENITSITWQPSWCLDFFHRILKYTGKKTILEVRPNFEVFLRWGMSIELYKPEYEKILPSNKVKYYQTYSASEWFFAVQSDNDDPNMYLLTDNGVFYEFIPLEEYGRPNPTVLTLNEVKMGEEYVLVITTNAWLRRYCIEDVIAFTSLSPWKIKITWRTKYYIDVASERTTVEHTDRALFEACKVTHAIATEYTVGPVMDTKENKFGHEWIIEFTRSPENIDHFLKVLDGELWKINSAYYDERHITKALSAPVIHIAPTGCFYNWLKSKNKIGGQFKVPKLANNRSILDELLTMLHV